MKLISYVGIERPLMVIQRATDLYAALDHIQSEMIQLAEELEQQSGEYAKDKKLKLEKCAEYISILMDRVEKDGFGNQGDIDSVEWS